MAATNVPKVMRAWQYSSIATTIENAIKLKELSLPLPPSGLGGDSILVKVYAASLNPADYKFPELPGFIARRIIPVPATPLVDFSGTVAAVGAQVSNFRVGQRVFGRMAPTSWGALGEYVAVSSKDAIVVELPERVSFEAGSGLGVAAQTSYQCIAPYVQAGDKVFVNGGSGGTGVFGIQIAKALGCHVTTSCSGRNADFCRSLGADEVIDYTKDDVSAVLRSKGPVFSLVFDTIGSSPADLYTAADAYLKPTGRFMQIGAAMSLAGIRSVMRRLLLPSILGGGKRKIKLATTKNTPGELDLLVRWVAEGKVKVPLDEVFPFDKAPDAFAKLRTGRARGKIVVKIVD